MPKVIFILGLCASGKTYYANEMIKISPAELFDEGFNTNFDKNYGILVNNLRNGKDCIVIEMEFRSEEGRKIIKQKLSQDLPGVKFMWKCFENNIEKANKNIRKRTNKGDPKGHIEINSRISQDYEIPDDAEILPIITEWNYNN